MELKKVEGRIVKCELSGCTGNAKYRIGIKKGIFGGDTFLCEKCLKELYFKIGEMVVPSSPTNILKTKQKNKEQK